MKSLIFDFDGTIADSFEALLEVFEEITARPQKLTARQVKVLRGKSLKDIIKYLKIRRWQLPGLIIKARRLIAVKIAGVKSFDDMPETLRALNSTGAKMFILSTNSSENISKFLRQNQLDGYFVKTYGDIGLRGKASALKMVIKREKLSPADCVYIGDEVRDIEAAKKADITSVGVTWGFNDAATIKAASPDYAASRPGDLLRVLG